jgi:hypothetical protein
MERVKYYTYEFQWELINSGSGGFQIKGLPRHVHRKENKGFMRHQVSPGFITPETDR